MTPAKKKKSYIRLFPMISVCPTRHQKPVSYTFVWITIGDELAIMVIMSLPLKNHSWHQHDRNYSISIVNTMKNVVKIMNEKTITLKEANRVALSNVSNKSATNFQWVLNLWSKVTWVPYDQWILYFKHFNNSAMMSIDRMKFRR